MLFRKIKSSLFNFFHFNKQERNGVFVLCIIIAVLFGVRLLMPFVLNRNDQVQLINISIPSIVSGEKESVKKESVTSSNQVSSATDRFVFNPNTITEEDAIKLGLSKKLSSTLINFRNKGGKFYKPEDFKKLYGVTAQLYNELEQYMLIPGHKKELRTDTVFPKRNFEKKLFTRTLLEINTADSMSIVFLKGIGPGFTKRIIKYRNLLGGFHSLDQLKEIYGMTDSLFTTLSSQILVNQSVITKIPINQVDFNTLKKHPYFNFQAAQAIINFRNKHGKLSESDIKTLGVFNEEKLKLILPYLSY